MGIDVDITNEVATVTFNRPEAMNSIDGAMRQRWFEIWPELERNDAVRVVIVTGAGDKAFSTGSDLKNTPPPQESFAELLLIHDNPGTFLHKFGIDKPIIAAVNGYAVGGGMELALACDICIASKNAKFGITEAKVGSVPGSGGVQRLPRSIGKSDAMLMILGAEIIDAHEALRMGFVSRVVPHEELLTEARRIADRIRRNAPLSVRALKRGIMMGLDMPLAHALEMDKYMYGLMRDTHDRLEGRQAFQEKRKPNFQGR
ncbi:enoyl-CoA hydratase-related protein [Chelativorans sp. Marseille-P2723]|uniref:enoyl-CoA hydratase/isomerase family protein n=1 Tax=Chelativorans sp. Marseille-P2723 TaxID=2709133 RepID=UPI00156DF36B|nr:enoyl-CoA hydratase-related protein [Chelativorans sp. Marseille-P2723]